MRVEHVALYVNDLEGARAFFERFFGATSGAGYLNPVTRFRSYFLTFDDGARLEVMTKPDMSDAEKDLARTGWAHLAFSVGSASEVDRLTAELAEAGYEIVGGPRTTGDGYYESCVLGPENNLIEITV